MSISQGWRALTRAKTKIPGIALAAVLAIGFMIPGARSLSTMGRAPTTVPAAAPTAPSPAVVQPDTAPTWDLANLDHLRVDRWVTRFTTDLKDEFARTLERMADYRAMISSKLAQRDMPQDLIYLAAIESEFNPTAQSPAHASGLWQFVSATARRYGLTVGHGVDERKDPAKETDAALAYLSDLYDRFGSWYLAAAAYNTGEGRVAKLMQTLTGHVRGTDADYYRISDALPAETREYVPKMIAAARIAKEPEKYGFE